MTTPALLGYPTSLDSVIGPIGNAFIIDEIFGNVYEIDATTASEMGIRKWDAYPNGVALRERTIADLGTSSISTHATMTAISQEIIANQALTNSVALLGFLRTDLSNLRGSSNISSVFGTDNSGTSASTAYNILLPQQICAFNEDGQDYIATSTLMGLASATHGEVNVVNWSEKLNARYLTTFNSTTETATVIGSLPGGVGTSAYGIAYPGGGSDFTSSLGIYNISASGLTRVGGVTPAQIDATWTHILAVVGLTVDQTDGNIIFGVTTDDAVTHTSYLVKVNAVTAAVMWTFATPHGVQYVNEDMAQNVIQNGKLYWFDGVGGTLYQINTLTGATTSTSTPTGLSMDATHGHQMSEDITNSLFVWGGWTQSSLVPTYLGNFFGVLGNTSGSQMGLRWFPNGTPVPPNVPAYAVAAQSRKRAWSFTLDGHTFYVLDLGNQGTFLYDITTKQWCKFITVGAVQWNVANGNLWGNRIVGGDLATTQVWEMQPGALLDNGMSGVDIVRTVTGGLQKRNRVFSSVESLKITASFGDVDDPSDATITLRFSDDQGNTWSPYFSITLQANNFSQELAFRSLGAFAAPGRIFEVQDVGGVFSISGVDCAVDNFDDASEQPPEQKG